MANLDIAHAKSRQLVQPQALAQRTQRRRADVIEISDDSDPPTPPRPRQLDGPPAWIPPRRAIPFLAERFLDSDSDDDFHSADSGSDHDVPLSALQGIRSPNHRNKRAKLYHSPPLRQAPNHLKIADSGDNLPHQRLAENRRPEAPLSSVSGPSFQVKPNLVTSSVQSKHAAATADNTFEDSPPAPYYYDTIFDVEMYRGHGFEKFPVVLGTVEGHREICEKFKSKTSIFHSSSSDMEEQTADTTDEHEGRCIRQVVEVFPDIDKDFVLHKLRDPCISSNDGGADQNAVAIDIVSTILEMDSYPKASRTSMDESAKFAPFDETGATVPYNKGLLKGGPYLKEAVILLAPQFKHVPTHFINKVIHEKRSLFDSYVHLQELESNYYTLVIRPYTRFRHPRVNLEKKYARGEREHRNDEAYAQMVNELQAAKQYVAREARKLEKQKEKEQAEAINLAIHKASGSVVQCGCCFDDEIPMNRSVGCGADGDIHFFCFACVTRLADTQVGMMKHEMLCMDLSGCKASLTAEGVGQAVPIKTLDRLALNQQQAEIAAAGIEGLEQCPYCEFKAICDPIEDDSIFNCQNPDCARASCRRCHEEAHVPRTCEEVKADRGLNARHRIEEARSDSVLRKCPKCGVKIIKELGCNKMVCTNCRCIMCYNCQTDITKGKEGGYEHFHKAGSKCKLYDEQGVDRHEIEADEAEEEAIKKAKAEDANLDEKQLQIETGPGQKKRVAPRGQLGLPPHHPELAELDHLLLAPRGNLDLRERWNQIRQQRQALENNQRQMQARHAHILEQNHGFEARMAEARRQVNVAQANLDATQARIARLGRINVAEAHAIQQPHLQHYAVARNPYDMAAAAPNRALGNNRPAPNLPAPQQRQPNPYLPQQPDYNFAFNPPVPGAGQQAAGLNQDIAGFLGPGLPLNMLNELNPYEPQLLNIGVEQWLQQVPGQYNQHQQRN